jgi:hypothetical protein
MQPIANSARRNYVNPVPTIHRRATSSDAMTNLSLVGGRRYCCADAQCRYGA